jgi:ParB/RepB/Spo0J family partition protein
LPSWTKPGAKQKKTEHTGVVPDTKETNMNDKEETKVTEERLEHIKLSALFPTRNNTRVLREGDPRTAELAESIKATKGLLQPVIVRPLPPGPVRVSEDSSQDKSAWRVWKGHAGAAGVKSFPLSDRLSQAEAKKLAAELAGIEYELLAGYRRYMAHRLMGADTIKATVRDVDDKTALEITVIENLQRSELTAMEEAAGIQKLVETGHTLQQIGAEIGKSAAYVCRRAQLTALTENWRSVVSKMQHKQPPAAILELVAALPPDAQDALLGNRGMPYWLEQCDIREMKARIAEAMHQLKFAGWFKTDDALLVPVAGACAACKKRSGCQPLLFEDNPEKAAGNNDRCLDAACWETKQKAWVAIKIDEAAVAHPNLIRVYTGDSYSREMEEDKIPRAGKNDWDAVRLVKQATPGAKPAIVVKGAQAGNVVWVKTNQSTGEGRKAKPRDKDGNPVPKSPAEKMKELEARRDSWIVTRFREKVLKDLSGCARRDWTRDKLLAVAVAFGTYTRICSSGDTARWNRYFQLLDLMTAFPDKRDDMLEKFYLTDIAPVFQSLLHIVTLADVPQAVREALRIADLFQYDMGELRPEAAAEIPIPKSWGMKEDPWLTPAAAGPAAAKGKPQKKRAAAKAPRAKKEAA